MCDRERDKPFAHMYHVTDSVSIDISDLVLLPNRYNASQSRIVLPSECTMRLITSTSPSFSKSAGNEKKMERWIVCVEGRFHLPH